MKILLVYGEKNAGKTTVCHRVFSALKGLGAIVEHYERVNECGDFKTVLTFYGSKIAIYTAGDEKCNLVDARKLSEDWECDVLVAAVSQGIHYNETLEDLTCEKDFFWHTLDKGKDMPEMEGNELCMAFDLLDKIAVFIKLRNN